MSTIEDIKRLQQLETDYERAKDELETSIQPTIDAYIKAYNRVYATDSRTYALPEGGWSLGHSNSYWHPIIEDGGVNITKYYRGGDSDLPIPMEYFEDPEKWEADAKAEQEARLAEQYEKRKADIEAAERAQLAKLKAKYEDES